MKHKSDWEKDNLKGKIKSQIITYYKVYDDVDNNGAYIKSKSGSIVRNYDMEGHRQNMGIFDQNNKQSQIMLDRYSYSNSEFNEQTDETEESYFTIQDKHAGSKIYKFMPNKLDYEWIWRCPDGDIAHKKKYTFTEKGLLIKEEYFNSRNEYIDFNEIDFWEHAKGFSENNVYNQWKLGVKHAFILYNYNDQELLLEKTFFYKEKEPCKKFLYLYNDYGLLIEKREYWGICLTAKSYTCHEDGTSKVESLFDKDKDYWSKLLYMRDNQGLIIERKEYDSNSHLKERRIYDYDAIGNLTLEERYSPQERLLNYIEFNNIYFPY